MDVGIARMTARMEEMGKQIVEMNNQMGKMEINMRSLNGNLYELRDAIRERGRDKGKAPLGHELSPLYLPTLGCGDTYFGRRKKDVGRGRDVCKRDKRGKDSMELSRHPYHRLELFVFNGKEALKWIFHYERYFNVNHSNKREQLTMTSVCMKGIAYRWLK